MRLLLPRARAREAWRRWLRRHVTCPHPRWEEGGLVNFMTGKREYTCAACGRRVERAYRPVGWSA